MNINTNNSNNNNINDNNINDNIINNNSINDNNSYDNSINYSKEDIHYMKLAIKQAKKAALLDEVPIGCLIVDNKKIIGAGYKRRNTD